MIKLSRKSGRWLIIFGIIMIMMGIIFHLQSISLIGPSSSFMYANQDWKFNSLIVIGIGTTILILGLYLKLRNDKKL